MPTPVGHALGGLAVAWFARATDKSGFRDTRGQFTPLAVVCLIAAVAADVDILFGSHRTYTHSLGAVVAVGLVAWLIARRVHRGAPVRAAITVAAAYGTHILLDLLGKDTAPPFGLQALWPLSSRFYISGADLFMEISRRYWKPDEFIVGNLKAGAWELLVVGPVAALAWYLARRSRQRRQA
jgi:membrane-bound metal-dependent hydrolase YbcI (DUF457 family)